VGDLSGAIASSNFMYLTANYSIGVLSFHAGTSLPITVPYGKGYDMGIVIVLEKSENILTFRDHPAHEGYYASFTSRCRSATNTGDRISKLRQEYVEDALILDFEF
jgi:hypothetical protein